MSAYDYGKAAFLRLEELERRVSALERPVKTPEYSVSDYSFDLFVNRYSMKKEEIYCDFAHEITLNAAMDFSGGYGMTFNGESVPLSGGGFSGTLMAKEGKNVLGFEFSSSGVALAKATVTVGGYTEKRLIDRRLSAIGGDFYSYKDGDSFGIFQAGADRPTLLLYNVYSASADYSESGIFVSTVTRSGDLTVARYNESGTLVFVARADRKCVSAAVRVINGRVMIYSVTANSLFIGEISDGGVVTGQRTNIRAAAVSARTVGQRTYLLVEDVDGTVSVLTLSALDPARVSARKTVGRVKNARLFSYGGAVGVSYLLGGAVVGKKLVGDALTAETVLCVADEAVMLDSGAIVARTGREINIL